MMRKKLNGSYTNKNELIGIVSSGGFSSKFGFINGLLEECKIRLNNGEEIIIVQIAGLIARRIICESNKNQELTQGERIGMIRFGSRVDIYFNNYKNLVKQNQTTVAGETLIAKK